MAITKTELVNDINGDILASRTSAPFKPISWDYNSYSGDVDLVVKIYEDGQLAGTSPIVSGTEAGAASMTLVGDYPMNETSGDMIDAVNANNGDVKGGVTQSGTEYTFNGGQYNVIYIPDNDEHSFGDGLGNDVPFEVEFDADFDGDANTNQYVVSRRDANGTEWQVQFDQNKINLRLFENNGTAKSMSRGTGVGTLTGFNHYKIIYDGSKTRAGITIEINGTPASGYTDTFDSSYSGMANTNAQTVLGRFENSGSQEFLGSLKNLKIRKQI
ncbi:hypothetical protein ML462_14110 [Gramella lutea]|uniref:Lectin n=1 Tax=Christiangramia lutea TaxID=1607951 RepID=A0A9X2ABJ4_9FLAO|nr:hypothetical protein [Christiangramia lutea]MCH4824306.1 hypothetical protein [Christiangramia lutea]